MSFPPAGKDNGTLVLNSVDCNQKIGALLADPEGSPRACFFSRFPHWPANNYITRFKALEAV